MEITAAQYEQIARFLDGEMTLEEMEAFETELNTYPAMREQLDFEQQVRDSLMLRQEEMVIDTAAPPSLVKPEVPIKPMYKRKWFAFAAAASLLTVVTAVWLFTGKKPAQPDIVQNVNDKAKLKPDSAQQLAIGKDIKVKDSGIKPPNAALLFDEYFEKDTLPDEYPMFLADAFTKYESDDFAAIEKLDLVHLPQIRGADPDAEKQQILELGHYYKGIAFLKANNVDKALLNLQWVVKNSENDTLKVKAEWYMALGFLRVNKNKEAKKSLISIIKSNTYKTLVNKAKTLLDSLVN